MSNNRIAVSVSSFEKYGCVNCGCEYCYSQGVQGHGTAPVTCGECNTDFVILADDLTVSAFGFGEPPHYPERIEHPRTGTPKHEYVRPDVRPEEGGEFWSPRGVGYDLSGFVRSKQAGERIVEMVRKVIGKEPKTWLDYREREPNWIQLKVQVSDGFDLDMLCKLCREDGIITEERLRKSLKE